MSTQSSEQSLPASQNKPLIQMQPFWAGLLLAIAIGIASDRLAILLPRLGTVTLSILLGIIIGNLIPNMTPFQNGVRFAEKRILPAAIVFLGVELQLATLGQLGFPAIIIIAASISTSMLLSLYLGKFFGFSREFSVLMGAGNGICGSSAVAAMSSGIKAKEEDIGISISVVNLLGTIGIFTLPAIVGFLKFSSLDGGLLVGGTLQAVGQVVAAGSIIGDETVRIAIIVKMGRILLLGPLVIFFHSWLVKKQTDTAEASNRIQIPLFIIGFFALSLLASFHVFNDASITLLKETGKFLLVIAMAGVGLRIRLQTLYQHGLKAIAFGGIVATAQIIITILLVLLLV